VLAWQEPAVVGTRRSRVAVHGGERVDADARSLSPRDVTALQRGAGNAAIARLLASGAAAQRCAHPGCACGEADGKEIAVQRAKIDFGSLTWADFTGSPPAKFPAATYSGMHPLPSPLKQQKKETDTGTPCTLGTAASSEFEAERSLDPTALDGVKAYMWQEKSGVKADYKVGLKAATARVVKSCTKHFDNQVKEIAKDATKECKSHVAECQQAFADGQDSWELTLGDETVTVTDAARCKKGMVTECKAAFVAATDPAAYEFSTGVKPSKACPSVAEAVTGTATANVRADCDGQFKTDVAALHAAESDRLLAHEQLHFGITHKFATDLHEELAGAASSATETACGQAKAAAKAKAAFAKLKVDTTFAKTWKKAEKKRAKEQKAYDKATCHGLDFVAQEDWAGKF
jgi:hypothetical protein